MNDLKSSYNTAQAVIDNLNRVIIGKKKQVFLAVAALLADGHILLEDMPGSGKTMLAKSIAKSIDGAFRRIQFTPDLLPADLTGINYFNAKTSEFEFMPGPVFTNILLADEINRATPKTQAGLLECMEERQVTVDGSTFALQSPFLVIATQNPIEAQGVFPLPEAQLDRFLIRLSLGYADFESAVSILKTHDSDSPLDFLQPVASVDEINAAQTFTASLPVHEDILCYIARLMQATRELNGVLFGVSQRAGLALLRFSKACAVLQGRDYVIPDDVKSGAVFVFAHRLVLNSSERIHPHAAEKKIEELLESIPVPTEFRVYPKGTP